jgi:DNA invertase Pin-like site-specific DNA recombinase
MKKAYSYIRFSTPEQAKGDSLRRQTVESEKYALENGLELDTRTSFSDFGISAYDKSNITKGALGVFLKLIESGEIPSGSYLLVESLDRLSRLQILDALGIFTNIIRAGITIVTLKDKLVYSEQSINDNCMSLMMSLLIMSRANEESSIKSFRGRAAWDNKRANIATKRLTARCPYWLKPSSNQSGFEVIHERAAVVKNIFEMAKSGLGNYTITIRLNQEKVPTFSNSAKGWQESYIQKLLRNKAVYGELSLYTQRDGEFKRVSDPIENYYPPIISRDEWIYVNNIREERVTRGGARKGKNLSNLFSGLLKCGYCGGPMVMGANTKKKKTGEIVVKKILACSNAKRGLDCHYSSWDYASFELEFLSFCHSIDFSQALGINTNLTNEAIIERKKLISINAEIEENNIKLRRLLDLVETGDAQTQPATLLTRMHELEIKNSDQANEYKAVEAKAMQLEVIAKSQLSQHEYLVNTINQLNTLEDSQLHDLRIRLSTQIKKAIDRISLYPLGPIISNKSKGMLETGLVKSGYTAAEVEKYISNLNEHKDRKNKFMTILFKNQSFIQLTKSHVNDNFRVTRKETFNTGGF